MLSPDDSFLTLRARLLAALLGTTALAGCRDPARADPRPRPTASPTASVRAEAASPCGAGTATEQCFKPFTNARAVGTGELGPEPAPSEFDARGCLPKEKVTNGCCVPAARGPELKDQQCCYAFCEGPCCGRPFLVDGRARVADLRAGDGWCRSDGQGGAPPERALDPELAAALRDAWLDDARMEHASVAAFGRFLLQLVELGAPADLVRDAALAAADETRHAELCFGIAARFDGTRGPAPLSLEGACVASTLEDVLVSVIAEGCVGETIAALLAARKLELTTDPAIRLALRTIRDDEARHAELAWRFLRWSLDTGGPALRRRAIEAFAVCSPKALAHRSPTGAHLDVWHAFGRLTVEEQDDVARSTWFEVILPCVHALGPLEGHGGG